MHCRNCQNKYFEWTEGALSMTEKSAVDMHLQVCPECQRAFDLLTIDMKELDLIAAVDIEPDPFFITRLHAAIDQVEYKDKGHIPLFLKRSLISLGVAASLLLGIWLGASVPVSNSSPETDVIVSSNSQSDQDVYIFRMSDIQYVSMINNEE